MYTIYREYLVLGEGGGGGLKLTRSTGQEIISIQKTCVELIGILLDLFGASCGKEERQPKPTAWDHEKALGLGCRRSSAPKKKNQGPSSTVTTAAINTTCAYYAAAGGF